MTIKRAENQVESKAQNLVLRGTVVSNKMRNTLVVVVNRFVKHSKYKKYMKISKKYKAHYTEGKHDVGERVSIKSVRPISKDKHFIVI